MIKGENSGGRIMSENLIAYWRNWFDSEINIPITSDGYIFKYNIFHQGSDDGCYEWVCCTSKKKLYSFIKYFILPSIQLSRTIGIKESTVWLGVENYDDTIAYLNNSKFDNYQEYIETYKRWFSEIDKLEQGDASISELRNIITKICLEIGYSEYIFVELDVFENISSVGKTLVEDFESDNVLDILELELKMSKEQILELFDNINDNKFMLNKVSNILADRIM